MEMKKRPDQEVTLTLTEQEMKILFACLRESFATIGRAAYPTRIGVELPVAGTLGDELLELMEREGIQE